MKDNFTSDMLQESDADMETTFMLADTLYAKAKVPPTNNVCLWLGVSKDFVICFHGLQYIMEY
jgi:Prefoldin subunit